MSQIYSLPIVLLAISLILTGCGGSGKGVKVDVVIEKPLQSDIRATTMKSLKPGVVNPIEVSTERPSRTAAVEHPAPRWHVMIRDDSPRRPSMSIARSETLRWELP